MVGIAIVVIIAIHSGMILGICTAVVCIVSCISTTVTCIVSGIGAAVVCIASCISAAVISSISGIGVAIVYCAISGTG